MAEPVRKLPKVELVWDKKRILIGVTLILLMIGGAYFTKVFVLDNKQSQTARLQKDEGRVAGTSVKEGELIKLPSQEEFKNKIETIKKEVSNLKAEDVTKQEPVKKILQHLEELRASTEAQLVGGAKNAVCEEVKKIFCSQ